MSAHSPVSPSEGKVLTSPGIGGRRFVVLNGRRRWIDAPPEGDQHQPTAELPELVDDQIARRWCAQQGIRL